MYNVEFNKEEIDAAILQIGARIEVLKEILEFAVRKNDVKGVLEYEGLIKVVGSARSKMVAARYK